MKLLISTNGKVKEFSPDPSLGVVTVGRADSNDLALTGERGASRQHLTLERTVDGWKLVDQMSANGTMVNGEKLNFAFIKENDVIQIGETKIQVTGLNPAPGARLAPARPRSAGSLPALRNAGGLPAAGGLAPRPARAAGSAADNGEAAKAPAGYVPAKKFPVGALVAVSVMVLMLAGGGIFLMGQLGNGGGEQQIAETGGGPRQAELSDEDKAALALAQDVVSGTDSTVAKLRALENIQNKLKGKRGSKALSDITDMKATLTRNLDSEVNRYVDNALAASLLSAEEGNYIASLDKLTELDVWFASDSYLEGFAKPNRFKIDKARKETLALNDRFVASNYQLMWRAADEMRFDDALALCDDILARAYLEPKDREIYQVERAKLEALQKSQVPAEPTPDEPLVKKPSILDKVKKDEGKLPGKNPLLPNGARSEEALVAALQARLVTACKDGTMKGIKFKWKGNEAKIEGVSSNGRLKFVYSYKDKKTGEELVVPSSQKFEDLRAEDKLALFDVTPGLVDEDLLALVIFCFDNGWTDDGSRRALALFKKKNEWKEGIDNLIASKRRMAIPEGGFVEHDGALVTPEEKESAIFYATLRGVLSRFEKGIGNKDKKKREDSEKAFEELLAMGERAVQPSIEILQEVLDKEMINAKKATGILAADKSKMDGLMAELDRRREFALELIMDAEKYPYPYGPNQAEVQAEVDARVASVREIWNDPSKFSGQTNPEFETIIDKVREIANRMATIDPEQKYFTQTPEEKVEYISNIANEALNIRNYTGDDPQKETLYNINVKVMAYNEAFPTGEGHCDGEGREQVKVTNEYRIMFARVALKINDKLFWAAKHHSRYCVESNGGQIAHVIPGEPRGEGPGDRMKYEGYPGGGGENIHMNSAGPTAVSSHNSWCHSSGHHRNILTPGWRVLGSGKWQTIWTQCFGGTDEGEGNSVSKGGQ